MRITTLFVLFLLLISHPVLSQNKQVIDTLKKKPYTEFVFPSDINKYPLLFSTLRTNGEYERVKNFSKRVDREVRRFISEDLASRGFKHEFIQDIDGSGFDTEKYPYVIQTLPLEVLVTDASAVSRQDTRGNVYYENTYDLVTAVIPGIRIRDRRNSNNYAPFGYQRPATDTTQYVAKHLNVGSPESFFTALNRIIAGLDRYGAEKTFENELAIIKKIKIRSKVVRTVMICVCTAILVPLVWAVVSS